MVERSRHASAPFRIAAGVQKSSQRGFLGFAELLNSKQTEAVSFQSLISQFIITGFQLHPVFMGLH